jgi:LysM repeat protein
MASRRHFPNRHWLGACFLAAAVAFAGSGSAGEPAAETEHVVKKGETPGAIARQHKVSAAALLAINGLSKKSVIVAGQTLKIPAPGDLDVRNLAGPSTAPRSGSGVVRVVRGQQTVRLRVLDRRRHLVPSVLPAFGRLMHAEASEAVHPTDPRLVTIVAMVSDHFKGRDILFVSGFRPYSPQQYTPHSNHNVGRAIDFAVRGISNEVLRDYCRTFRNVGVGYYPNSSFVHLDVRAKKAYWVDYAGPGQRPRYHHPEEAGDADEAAGEVPVQGVPPRFGGQADDETGAKGSPKTRAGDAPSTRDTDGNSHPSDSTGETGVFPGH